MQNLEEYCLNSFDLSDRRREYRLHWQRQPYKPLGKGAALNLEESIPRSTTRGPDFLQQSVIERDLSEGETGY